MSEFIRYTVEILEEGEKVLGSPTKGRYMVRKFDGATEMSGEFFETLIDAHGYIIEDRGERKNLNEYDLRIQILEEKIAALEKEAEE